MSTPITPPSPTTRAVEECGKVCRELQAPYTEYESFLRIRYGVDQVVSLLAIFPVWDLVVPGALYSGWDDTPDKLESLCQEAMDCDLQPRNEMEAVRCISERLVNSFKGRRTIHIILLAKVMTKRETKMTFVVSTNIQFRGIAKQLLGALILQFRGPHSFAMDGIELGEQPEEGEEDDSGEDDGGEEDGGKRGKEVEEEKGKKKAPPANTQTSHSNKQKDDTDHYNKATTKKEKEAGGGSEVKIVVSTPNITIQVPLEAASLVGFIAKRLEVGTEKGLEKGTERELEKGTERELEKGMERGLEKGTEEKDLAYDFLLNGKKVKTSARVLTDFLCATSITK